MYYFDPYNVFLAIANIPQRLKTGFMVQGQIWSCKDDVIGHGKIVNNFFLRKKNNNRRIFFALNKSGFSLINVWICLHVESILKEIGH